MPDPFGEKTTPWWRSGAWWWEWCFGSKSVVPKRYSRPVAVVSALVVASTAGVHLDLAAQIAVAVSVLGIPSLLLEWWWKQRRRVESERLVVLPEAHDRERS
jgi:hypothetical protein